MKTEQREDIKQGNRKGKVKKNYCGTDFCKRKMGNNTISNILPLMKCLHNSRTAIISDHTNLPIWNVFQIGEEEQRSDTQFSPEARAGGGNGASGVSSDEGQAIKSARGMPWHQEPTKDVTSCDKLRGAAHTHRSVDFRMGKPGTAIPYQRALNKIGVRGEPPELKHLSRARKRHQPRFRK